ncbi:MAG: hypothetical protein GXO33_04950 [Epsilonproteobacteria bacterium]|nr:hypothetical protein [Campylobacterota bacterium]
MKTSEIIREIPLANSENGVITVAVLQEPYGKESAPVVSVGVWLNRAGGEPDWKIHVPKENVDALVEAIVEAKEKL